MNEYMIHIKLMATHGADILLKYPAQRTIVNYLMSIGKLSSYVASVDRTRLWLTMNANSKQEVVTLLQKFPIHQNIDYEIHQLTINEHSNALVPGFSTN